MSSLPSRVQASLRLRLAVLGAVGLLIAGATGVIGAVTSKQNGPFTGCLSAKLAVIYDIAASATTPHAPGCVSGDTVVTFSNAQGPAGPVGPIGAPGATGATGPQGAAGPAGLQGPKGDTGATGLAGAVGAQGPAGPKGDIGGAGPKGDTGATGPAGAPGTGGTLTNISDLNGVPCTIGSGLGTVNVSVSDLTGDIKLNCSSYALTVKVIPSSYTYSCGQFGVDICTGYNPASAFVSPPGFSVFATGGTPGQLTVHFAAGTQVTVTGTPNEGPCDTLVGNVCTVTMNSDRMVTVNP